MIRCLDCQDSQFDQLALCVVNFLQNEVKSLLRNTSADNPAPNTSQNLLSETVLNELDLTLQPTVNATDSDADDNGEYDESLQSNTSVLDTSITKLKQATILESNPIKTAKNNKSESTKLTKNKQCFDECKVKKTSKKNMPKSNAFSARSDIMKFSLVLKKVTLSEFGYSLYVEMSPL